MNPKIAEIVDLMRPRQIVSFQMAHMAELLALLAEEQEKTAARLERQTNKIIYLTWALVLLTAVLCFIAIKL